ncbi:MAG: MopE-related protein [Sandaracinaceae bacterium]
MLGALVVLLACGGEDPEADGGPDDADAGTAVVIVCARNDDCNDGLFCNGEESCQPGDMAAGEDGCVDGPPPCAAAACTEATDDCGCEEDPDRDGDGDPSMACGGNDCDDDDPARASTLSEICDSAGVDEDCVRDTLAGPTDGDQDGDSFVSTACCGPNGAGGTVCGSDCNDDAIAVNTGTPESCNGTDDDCDGLTDEGVTTVYYLDSDEDLYGDPETAMSACAPPTGFVALGGDCNDGDPSVRPMATESCNDVDDDCDGTTDEEAAELGSVEHCSVCGDACQLFCDARSCDRPERIFAGGSFACALTEGGRLYCWGNGTSRQLANGGVMSVSRPTLATAAPGGITDLSLGGAYACAVAAGELWCWGSDSAEQLGNGVGGVSPSAPVQISSSGESARSIASGPNYTCAAMTRLGSSDRLRCWGNDMQGQTATPIPNPAVPTTVEPAVLAPTAAALGPFHACAVSEGTVYCWGRNVDGRTGLGVENNQSSLPTPVGELSDVAEVAVGTNHSCALTSGGTVACWGAEPAIGVTPAPDSCLLSRCALTPATLDVPPCSSLSAGGSHTCVAADSGSVLCWGDNSDGELGDGTTDDASVPQFVPGISDAIQVAAGGSFTCVLHASRRVSCWGDNDSGQLGDGTTEGRLAPTPLATPLP